MKLLYIRYLMIIAVLLPYAVSAQQQLPGFAPTPTAASIAKFGDVLVSPFAGIPSISIPLYSFNVLGLELALRLDYDASVCEFGFDTDAIEYTTDFMRQSQSEKFFEYLENTKYSAYHVNELSEWWNQNNHFIATGTRRLNNIKIGSALTTEFNIIRLDYALAGRPHLRQVRWENPYNGTGVADRKYKLIMEEWKS